MVTQINLKMEHSLPNEMQLQLVFTTHPHLREVYRRVLQLSAVEQGDLLVLIKTAAMTNSLLLHARNPCTKRVDQRKAAAMTELVMSLRDQMILTVLRTPGLWDNRQYPPCPSSLAFHLINYTYDAYELGPLPEMTQRPNFQKVKSDIGHLIRLKLTKVNFMMAILSMRDAYLHMTDKERLDQIRLVGRMVPRIRQQTDMEMQRAWEALIYPTVQFVVE